MHPDLERLVAEGMARYHVPGVGIGIVHDGVSEGAGFGVTSVDDPLPVDADTLFQIASISKTITATAVMRLVERGSLDLDAPVRAYLPDLELAGEGIAARVTLRHLVTHTGGWEGDCFEDFGPGDDALARYVSAMRGLAQVTPLGEIWHYSNSSFALLGRLIEVATGATYEAAVRELVLGPLGMTRTCFTAAEAITHRVAVGHVIVDERPVVARPWAFPRATIPMGGIVSTVNDLLRYARFHLDDGRAADGTRLLAAGAGARMRTPLANADLDRSIGVSWFLREIGGVRFAFHGGVAIGQQGVLMLAPERSFAIVVQTNSARGGLLHQSVTTWAQAHYLGVKAPEPVFVELPRERYLEYAGRYTAVLSDAELAFADGALEYRSHSHNVLKVEPRPPDPPPSRVAFLNDDAFICLEGPLKDQRGEFLRGPDGRIRWLRTGGRVYRPAGD